MEINVLQKWLGLLLLCLESNGSVAIMRMTTPCRINTHCVLPCRLINSTIDNVVVLWYNDDDEILSQGVEIQKYSRNLRIEKQASDEWNLRIHRVSRNYEGKYQCKTNKGELLSEIMLIIEDRPKLDETKSSSLREYVTETTDATLNCIFSGFPEPEITWHRGLEEQKIEGIKGNKLIIRNVSRYAADDYTCVAINKHGDNEGHIRLIVRFSPTVSVMEETVSAVDGQEVEMGCIVQASPIIDVFWKNHKGQVVSNSTKYEVEEERESDIFPVRFVRLRIKRGMLVIRDAGDYACHGVGKDHETIIAKTSLKVEDKLALTSTRERRTPMNKTNLYCPLTDLKNSFNSDRD